MAMGQDLIHAAHFHISLSLSRIVIRLVSFFFHLKSTLLLSSLSLQRDLPPSASAAMEEQKPIIIIPSPSIQTVPNPNPNPNQLQSSTTKPTQKFTFPPRPPIRLTSEFDSDGGGLFFHKISCKLFDSLAKLKLSFQQSKNREISDPQIGIITKHVSLFYDVEEQNAFVKGNFNFGDKFQFRASQDIKAQEGEVAMVASFSDPSYKLELASVVPSIGLPRATLKFPLGEVSMDTIEREVEGEEEVSRALSISGIVKGQALNGMCTAQYKDDWLNLRYLYKDEEMTFIPSISVPGNSVSFAFKRQLSMSDKLSYWYKFDSNNWSTVYKHTIGKDLKLKAGYDSDVRLGWAALWVGDETGKTKTAPMKTKLQVMLQVPQDDIKSSVVLLHVKKRWDF